MNVEGLGVKFLLLTSQNKYALVEIDFDTNNFSRTEAILSIPGISNYDESLMNLSADFDSMGLAYVYGLTNRIGKTTLNY